MHPLQHVAFALGLIAFAIGARQASAQDATVFVTHRLTKQGTTPLVTHRLASDDTSRRRAGLPSRLDIDQGSRACVVVERANPVLYSYALAARPIKVAPPDTMAATLKALMALAQGATPSAAIGGITAIVGLKPAGTAPDPSFGAAVAAVYRQYLTLVDLKAASDTTTDFPQLARRIATTFADSVRSFNKVADGVFDALATKTEITTRMLRAQQLETMQRATSIAEEFATAASTLADPICTPALSGRNRVVLAIAPQQSGKEVARATGDSVLAFTVEAASDQDFEFGAGMMINTLARRATTLAVENGVVVEKPGDDVLIRPIFLGHYRNWGQRWLYATIGTAMAGKRFSDLFLGATSRFGVRSGVGVTFGIGLALSEQVVGLSQGRIGEPLPADVANLTDITRTVLKPGLGISLALSGF